MIANRDQRPPRRRTVREILALPRTDQEEAFCDEYIRQQCEAIRFTWDDVERQARLYGIRRDEVCGYTAPFLEWLGEP